MVGLIFSPSVFKSLSIIDKLLMNMNILVPKIETFKMDPQKKAFFFKNNFTIFLFQEFMKTI
jgi:hypothetical protein